jgi:hypothetical protein
MVPNATYDSDTYKKDLQQTAHSPCKAFRTQGYVNAAFAKGGKPLEADY